MEGRSCFISYSHNFDDKRFVRRLVFALSMYMDVFFDQNMNPGCWESQLFTEIESREFFIFVVTSEAIVSPWGEWCIKELNHAEKKERTIIFVNPLVTNETKDFIAKKGLQCAFFDNDFEKGFRSLTALMLSQPLTSWEALSHELDDIKLLRYLNQENYLTEDIVPAIPAVIAKELGRWILSTPLWSLIERFISSDDLLLLEKPFTPSGFFRQITELESQLNSDFMKYSTSRSRGLFLVNEIKKMEPLLQNLHWVKDNEHNRACQITAQIINIVKDIMKEYDEISSDAFHFVGYINSGFYEFSVAEKLRDLINLHSSRSRYLY